MAATVKVERDPRFATWEDERAWLASRECELSGERDAVDADAEQEAYAAAEADGYEPEYCEAQAAKIAARRKELKKAFQDIRARLVLIGPPTRKERAESKPDTPGKKQLRWEKSQESQGEHIRTQERIAVALERIADALERKPVRRKCNGKARPGLSRS